MRRVAAIMVTLAALRPEVAVAGGSGGSCGPGGDSADSGSSSTRTTFVSSGTDYAAPTCVDDTDVVGYRRCKKFGAWSSRARPLFFELGTSVRQFGSLLGGRIGHVSHDEESFAFRAVTTEASPQDVAVTTAVRFGVGLPHGVYAGAEVEMGGLVAPAAARAETMTGPIGPYVQQGRGFVAGGFAVIGVRGDTRHASLAVEGAAGGRAVAYEFDSGYGDCAETTAITAGRGVVEARARGELFLHPFITAGATVGTNVLARGEWMGGVYLGFHTRAFGGRR